MDWLCWLLVVSLSKIAFASTSSELFPTGIMLAFFKQELYSLEKEVIVVDLMFLHKSNLGGGIA